MALTLGRANWFDYAINSTTLLQFDSKFKCAIGPACCHSYLQCVYDWLCVSSLFKWDIIP